jgi:uncharacterized membrane protein
MKNCFKTLFGALAVVTAAAAIAQTRLPDLGAGGSASELNNNGLVVGSVFDPMDHLEKAAVWRNGELTVLASMDMMASRILNVSDSGFKVGVFDGIYNLATEQPARWNPAGEFTALPTLGAGGRASSVLNDGTAVGYVFSNTSEHLTLACKWLADGTLVLLRNAAGELVRSKAIDINEGGHIAGELETAQWLTAATKWSNDTVTNLDNEEWTDVLSADSIIRNNSLLLRKFNYFDYNFWTVLRRADGTELKVATFSPGRHEFVEDMNNSENLTGFTYIDTFGDPNMTRGVVWIDALTPRLLPMDDETLYSFANGINDAGNVAGTLVDYVLHKSYPVVWDPLPGLGLNIATRGVKGSPGQFVNLSATLTSAGRPVANEPVRFLRADNSLIGIGRTNANGVAAVNFQIPTTAQPLDKMDFMASLGGGRYSRGTMEVAPFATGFTVPTMSGVRGQNVGVFATLMNRSTNRPLANQTVTLTLNGQTWTVRTGSNGNAVINYRVPTNVAVGTRLPVRFRFAGNATHNAVQADGTLTVR